MATVTVLKYLRRLRQYGHSDSAKVPQTAETIWPQYLRRLRQYGHSDSVEIPQTAETIWPQ